MTTTVYDRESKIIAADTRWSAQLVGSDDVHYIAFTDDSVFEKIADRPNATMVMAGNGQLIAEWKRWWFESLDTEAMPAFEVDGATAIVLLIINKLENKWIFDVGRKLASICSEKNEVNAIFSGSGSSYAANCWTTHRCAKTAIFTASVGDPFTGEKVRYVDFDKNQSNIEGSSYDYQEIVSALTKGGFIMAVNENTVIPLTEHPLAQEVSRMLASGDVVACAPMPEMKHIVWNDERKDKLKDAIKEVRILEGID